MEEDAPIQKSPTDFVTGFFQKLDRYKKLMFRYFWIPVLTLGASLYIQNKLLKKVHPTFVSESKMFVNPRVSVGDGNLIIEDQNNFMANQMWIMQSENIRSRTIATLMEKHPELKRSPVSLSVGMAGKTSIFNLQAAGEDQDYTQAYLQTLMEEFIKAKREMLRQYSSTARSGLEESLKALDTELESNKTALNNFEATNKEVLLQQNGINSAVGYLQVLQKKLDEARSALEIQRTATFDQNLQMIEEENLRRNMSAQSNGFSQGFSTNVSAEKYYLQNTTPSHLGEFEDSYLAAKRQLALLISTKEKRIKMGITNDTLQSDELDKQIAAKKLDMETLKSISQETLANRQHILELEVTNLERQVANQQTLALEVGKKMSAYEVLKDNLKRLQDRWDETQKNLQKLDMNQATSQESLSIREPASWAAPVPPDKTKHLVMAGLIGMALGLGIVFFIDRLDDRPGTLAELEKLFDVPLLGQFPLMKGGGKKGDIPVLQADDSRYPLIEACHSLRSALLYRESFQQLPKDQPKSIVITSARPDDGKSLVAANFAVTLAQTGARVLLIDADMRRGVLHKHFSATQTPGLAEVLAGKSKWPEALVQTHIPSLHLMPCGSPPRNPGNLFATAGRFIQEIAGHYDFYLFDTAPVLVGDDVLSLAPQTDGLLMVVRAGFTSGRVARAAMGMLRARRVNVMGIVFNAVSPKSSDYYYYRYKEYYPDNPAK